jgi:hypothetical protein
MHTQAPAHDPRSYLFDLRIGQVLMLGLVTMNPVTTVLARLVAVLASPFGNS